MGAKNRGADPRLELRVHWATAGGHHLSKEDLNEIAQNALKDSADKFSRKDNYLIVDTSQIKVGSGGKIEGKPRMIALNWATPKMETSILPHDVKQIEMFSTTSPEIYLKKEAVLFCRRPLADSNETVRHKSDPCARPITSSTRSQSVSSGVAPRRGGEPGARPITSSTHSQSVSSGVAPRRGGEPCARPITSSTRSESVSSGVAPRRGRAFIPWDKEGTWSSERSVTCEPFSFNADVLQAVSADGLGIKVHLEFSSEVQCTRSGSQAKVKLTIPNMNFGIATICDKCSRSNESCERKCGQRFISEVTIEVRPIDWAQGSHELEPSHAAQIFTVQNNDSYNVQAAVPRHVGAGYQVQKGIAFPVPSDKWGHAVFDFSSKSVTWSWKFVKFAEGTDYKLGNYWRINSSKQLLEGNPAHLPIKPPVSATWNVRPEVEVQQQLRLAWKMSIIVETSVLKGKWPLSILPVNLGHSVDKGPTIAFEGKLSFA